MGASLVDFPFDVVLRPMMHGTGTKRLFIAQTKRLFDMRGKLCKERLPQKQRTNLRRVKKNASPEKQFAIGASDSSDNSVWLECI
jgi:hypothetical protein